MALLDIAVREIIEEFESLCISIGESSNILFQDIVYNEPKKYKHAAISRCSFTIDFTRDDQPFFLSVDEKLSITHLKKKIKNFLLDNLECCDKKPNDFPMAFEFGENSKNSYIERIRFVDGYIMEGKTNYVNDAASLGFPVLKEKSDWFRTKLRNGKQLLEYPELVGVFATLFLNAPFEPECLLIIERSPISCMIFDGFSPNYLKFYFAFLSCFVDFKKINFELELFLNLEPKVPSVEFNRSFEMKFIKSADEYSKIATAYYLYYCFLFDFFSNINYDIKNGILNNDQDSFLNHCMFYFHSVSSSCFDKLKRRIVYKTNYHQDYTHHDMSIINFSDVYRDVYSFICSSLLLTGEPYRLELQMSKIKSQYFSSRHSEFDATPAQKYYGVPNNCHKKIAVISNKTFTVYRPYASNPDIFIEYHECEIANASAFLIDSDISNVDFAVGFAVASGRPIYILKVQDKKSKYEKYATKEFHSFYSFETFYNDLENFN